MPDIVIESAIFQHHELKYPIANRDLKDMNIQLHCHVTKMV